VAIDERKVILQLETRMGRPGIGQAKDLASALEAAQTQAKLQEYASHGR
jgi:hypothetical protein